MMNKITDNFICPENKTLSRLRESFLQKSFVRSLSTLDCETKSTRLSKVKTTDSSI